jgi:hypothetical protein
MKSCRTSMNILRSDSGLSKTTVILLLLAAAGYWYWNFYTPSAKTGTGAVPVQAPAPASPQPSTEAKQEPAYDNPQEYAKKFVSFAGVIEGKLDRPGLILRFDNRGDRDISNLSVQIMGYKEFYVMDPSKAQGTEYTVELEVKSFPAKKVTETVLYFPPGVLSISRGITIYNASF